MKDNKGTPIVPGQKLVRITPGRVTDVGYEYKVIEEDGELKADGGFVKETLSVERAKDYSVTEQPEE
ncbi:MAG: hypothetical protein EOO27_02285 [Comamonadaceae bacterium]|nr:MAG: hypothetical protein EOO27_02285 [Comamonadaceae bacterium]